MLSSKKGGEESKAGHGAEFQFAATCRSKLQCDATCCGMLQHVSTRHASTVGPWANAASHNAHHTSWHLPTTGPQSRISLNRCQDASAAIWNNPSSILGKNNLNTGLLRGGQVVSLCYQPKAKDKWVRKESKGLASQHPNKSNWGYTMRNGNVVPYLTWPFDGFSSPRWGMI